MNSYLNIIRTDDKWRRIALDAVSKIKLGIDIIVELKDNLTRFKIIKGGRELGSMEIVDPSKLEIDAEYYFEDCDDLRIADGLEHAIMLINREHGIFDRIKIDVDELKIFIACVVIKAGGHPEMDKLINDSGRMYLN